MPKYILQEPAANIQKILHIGAIRRIFCDKLGESSLPLTFVDAVEHHVVVLVEVGNNLVNLLCRRLQ